MAYTDFCCRSGGSNLNAGTRTGNTTVPGTSADFTYLAGTLATVANVSTFTTAGANPVADGVAVGDFISCYVSGATATGFVGVVTSRTAAPNTIVFSAINNKAGTVPADGTVDLKVGGAWAGPASAVTFPFSLIQNTLTNTTGNPPRINFKNDLTPSMTANCTNTNTGPITWQGFTTAYGDLGRTTFSFSTNVVDGITGGSLHTFVDLIATSSAASGTNNGFTLGSGATRGFAKRCSASGWRNAGFLSGSAGSCKAIECEAYGNNTANSLSRGGFVNVDVKRCIASGNTGSNSLGFYQALNAVGCIAVSNGSHGFHTAGAGQHTWHQNDAYANGGDGFNINAAAAAMDVENCNSIDNTGWGIRVVAGSIVHLANNRFGAAGMANGSGNVSVLAASAVEEINSDSYANDVTPWTDPANGDFRINLAAAKNVGRGVFTQTQSGKAGTVSYPDIGAAQATVTASAGGAGVIG
jgi:hypothetical protein